ncbi:heat shock protein HslJ [Parabacteroides sp. PF5-5]|uniref:META domain-containing protein n=1 Tax=unclassified Parabacteroides TaxID=2649774 RepID=UPI0024760B5D|nr:MULTISPECIES: META domain-containing protein [unclassified Parabacteroides]MDH6305060.1 heat shock protein HslJ [Parabacteroides sp. PH5-39]MDH6315855.1 heat shock protein HslJ [Parabacteroides sp. PF5-13]MDH6319512.1 heat shock protein HslJ [Parabacteroides sp. PH5-13]MDH6323243.1 heat shock protein HslJ [Parabacteroides sp. PH5-8]MDH6327249.1 heat shock protein HslJ [Parabacteroides sp. PH5-41]
MKKFIYISMVFAVAVLFTGCKTKQALSASFDDLQGEWGVVELNGNALNPEETHQTMEFDMTRQLISGNAGCNRMSGKVEYNESQKNIIKFSRMITTRKACLDMKKEDELLKTLDKVVRFEAAGNEQIAFYGADSSKLLVIEKKK